ncbi:hypothetical protein [Bradyrhizobium sp. NFR13]|uniref:hypothetical protein n=1 Tax=Bradyrhizobium sp. NFR13 TaxID=1566285 RepID=UPI002570E92B|nr:hypothetical protein [Bradyrhizobium sp. NFR13]
MKGLCNAWARKLAKPRTPPGLDGRWFEGKHYRRHYLDVGFADSISMRIALNDDVRIRLFVFRDAPVSRLTAQDGQRLGFVMRALRWFHREQSFSHGHRALRSGQRQHEEMSTHPARAKRPALLIDGKAKPFDPAAFGACVSAAPGYWMGFDATVRARSIADTVLPSAEPAPVTWWIRVLRIRRDPANRNRRKCLQFGRIHEFL